MEQTSSKKSKKLFERMYVCMYVCMCMYDCMYVCMYVCMYYRTEMQQVHRLNAMRTRPNQHERAGRGEIGYLRCDSKQHLTNDCDRFCCTCGGSHHHSRYTEDFMTMRCGDCQGKHVTKMCPYRIIGISDFIQRRIDKRETKPTASRSRRQTLKTLNPISAHTRFSQQKIKIEVKIEIARQKKRLQKE